MAPRPAVRGEPVRVARRAEFRLAAVRAEPAGAKPRAVSSEPRRPPAPSRSVVGPSAPVGESSAAPPAAYALAQPGKASAAAGRAARFPPAGWVSDVALRVPAAGLAPAAAGAVRLAESARAATVDVPRPAAVVVASLCTSVRLAQHSAPDAWAAEAGALPAHWQAGCPPRPPCVSAAAAEPWASGPRPARCVPGGAPSQRVRESVSPAPPSRPGAGSRRAARRAAAA